METNKTDKRITIIGQLIPSEDDQDRFGIGIMTDEGPYGIELNSASEQLLDFLYQDIKATGVIDRQRKGYKRIIIDDFVVLD